MFERKIAKLGKDKQYMDVTWAALEKYPKDYSMQLKYVKDHGTKQQYAFWMVDRLQDLSYLKSGKKIEINCSDIELIFRSFKDSQKHMQPNLPEGVYNYIVNRMEDSILDIVNKIENT